MEGEHYKLSIKQGAEAVEILFKSKEMLKMFRTAIELGNIEVVPRVVGNSSDVISYMSSLGKKSSSNMTQEQRSARAKKAVDAREAKKKINVILKLPSVK